MTRNRTLVRARACFVIPVALTMPIALAVSACGARTMLDDQSSEQGAATRVETEQNARQGGSRAGSGAGEATGAMSATGRNPRKEDSSATGGLRITTASSRAATGGLASTAGRPGLRMGGSFLATAGTATACGATTGSAEIRPHPGGSS
ncbi:hypothetical protein ACFL5O_08850 [Myxococcota bacterium]